MAPAVSRRMQEVQLPMIPIVGQWIAQHPGTISLGQGVVHYGPPSEVVNAVTHAAHSDGRLHRYGLVSGIQDLLEAISQKLMRENGVSVGPQQRIIVTPGSNKGFVNAVLAMADVDDEIILLTPFYFNHEMAISMAGCRPVLVPVNDQYQIDLAQLEAAITSRTKAIVTISPNNPTGAVYPESTLRLVNRLCAERGLYHVSDEAYEQFVYDGRAHFSPASIVGSEAHTVSLFSLSKAFGMAGWRIGFMVIPAELETAIKKIQDTTLVCTPIVSQVAATAALRVGADWCASQIAGFEQVRDHVLAELSRLGDRCSVPRPEGAFYVLARFHTERTDVELVERLIREFGVAVMPGRTFGVTGGCSLRIAYGALDRKTVAEGMGRLVRGLDALL